MTDAAETQEVEYTEAELTGEVVADPTPTSESAETPPPGDAAAPTEPEPAKAEPAPVPTKPPEGFVPKGALDEERIKRREMDRQIRDLTAKLNAFEKPPEKGPRETILEDPENAIGMLEQQIADLRGELDRRDMEGKIKTVVPDFMEKAPQMEEALRNRGFSDDAIVNIIGAAGQDVDKFFGLLNDVVKAQDTKALRDQITAEVTRDVMVKFKITDPGVNISKLPGSANTGKLNIESDADYENLTPEQKKKWLSGEL